MKTRISVLAIFILFLVFGSTKSYAQSSAPAFFATLFSDKPALEVRDELVKFGAHKAAKVEMGEILEGAPYFHFTVPRENFEATLTYLKSSGTLMLDGSQDPLSSDSKEIRFVMWLAPVARLKKLGTNTMLIQRIVKNPSQVREEMRAYLKSKKLNFNGQLYLNVKVKNLVEYERIMFYAQSKGNLLIKQTPNWDGKTLRFSFSQQKSSKGAKTAQLFFTPARDISKADLQHFQEKVWSQPSGVKELPAFYIEVVKYGDLSIYPGRKNEDLQKNISQSALRKIEAKVIGMPPPKDVYETMINAGDGLYLESSDEVVPSYLSRATIRGYYQGVLPLSWNDEALATKNGYFELYTQDPILKAENVLKVGEDEKSRQLSFMVDDYPANALRISGSVVKNKVGKMAVLTTIQANHWFERPFNVPRMSPYFQNIGVRARFLQFTNFLDRDHLMIVGAELSYRTLHKIQSVADGLILGALVENISSGEFHANALGVNLSYETEFPFPLFDKMPKTFEAFVRAHVTGPSLRVEKSMIYGFRGKLQITESFYIHGGLQKMEANIDNSAINRSFNANVMMFDGGFGARF